MENLPPFYVGQRVVALKTHRQGYFKKGDEFIVVGVKKVCCAWGIDIGIAHDRGGIYCLDCKHTEITNVGWCNVSLFAPINENFQSITLEKVLETETPLISVN